MLWKPVARAAVALIGLAASAWAADAGSIAFYFEQRTRLENRSGIAFGRDQDIETALLRTRFGVSYTPVKWLRVSGMVQDARAPWYGPGAPGSARDPADLHEGFVELFPGRDSGFGMSVGRKVLNYGEGRLIGSPQWGNSSRTFDHGRVYYRWAKARIDILLVSPVRVRPGEFNRPALGERVWGIYGAFSDIGRKNLLDVYLLRHDTATDRRRVNTAGFRAAGPAPFGMEYAVDGAAQTGSVAGAPHRATAWVGSLRRQFTAGGKPVTVSGEYKFASAAFDQLYPSNHDRFGHQDLFGWRNIHNTVSTAAFDFTGRLTLNLMYADSWLSDPRGALYDSAGRPVARSAAGDAGRHVGREADCFATYKAGRSLFGAGYGRLLAGEFLRKTTPGVGPNYVYVFHRYTFGAF